MKPKLFIGSSVEGLGVAYAIQQNLVHDTESTVWDQGVFELSRTSIESLDKVLDKSDFGVFVFSPDDITVMRKKESKTIRDNVLFEFGLFIGKLGRDRVFFVLPEGEIHIPTDLLGVTPGKYNPNREDESLQAATGPACNQIRQAVKKLKLLNPQEIENTSIEDDDKKTNETDGWIHNIFENEFSVARKKLNSLKKGEKGEKALVFDLWLKYIDLKENEVTGLDHLINFIKSNVTVLKLQTLGARMLMWEKYEEISLEVLEHACVELKNDPALLVIKSECLNSLGNKDGAISLLLENVEDITISIALAELYEKDNISKALEVINKAYKSFPSNKPLVYKYARLLQMEENDKEALYLLNYLTAECPDKALYWGHLSNTCFKLDLYDKAMLASKKAIELSKHKEAWLMLNIGNMMNFKGFYTEAIEWLNKGLKIDDTSDYAHERLSQALKSKNKQNDEFTNMCRDGRIALRKR